MIHIKLKNVSVCYGKRFRHNQNYSMTFFEQAHGVNGNTTEEDLKKLIEDKYSKIVYLNSASKLEIVTNTSKSDGV